MSIPKVVDLFSGCGGLALGFEKAGFEICFGVDIVQAAVDTVSYNFDFRYGREATHICADITQLNGDVCKGLIGENGCIVIGGPPCQAYSRIGRAKLRSLGKDRIHTNDSRGLLFKDFIRFALELDARAIIMENVVEAVDYGGINIPELVCSELDGVGYSAKWTILNAADYGVPQVRERIILLATKKGESINISLPEPSNINHYKGNLSIYSNRLESFVCNKYFQMPMHNTSLTPWVSVGDALSDLPELMPDANSKYKPTPIGSAKKYRNNASNEFQQCMRNWYGKETTFVTGNAYRKTERDFQIFEKMNQGDNYVEAAVIADRLFENEAEGLGLDKDDTEYNQLKRKRVPVYDREKFKAKWKRLSYDKPSHTLVAHLSKDTYSHIHPLEPRGISVREAARLQSFPDDFYFSCSMGDAFKQIGNAVPPLLAYAIAKKVYEAFQSTGEST